MLKLDQVSKTFGETRAVDRVTLDVRPGEMVGVIGRSGAGKSTLLRLVNRLIDPTAGRVLFGETDVTAMRGRELRLWRARTAMIFQQFNLVPRLDVLTNVLIGRISARGTVPSMAKIFSDEERTLALRALDRLGLVPQALQRAETLSGGQQQRVAIARALVQQPRVVLADEPIASLDPVSAEVVMTSLRQIHERDGLTVICNLHTLDTARSYCDRVIGMLRGRVVFDGPAHELTGQTVRDIYGTDHLDENVTSTSIAARPQGAGARLAALPAG